ncbi:hypothetical protein [Psychrobacter sp. W2-37-MNA-CIBAN-0211]|uniref:hypothetical protein n=1 Tax=unclassified Psychrobacter TaxID=196806 RepID=UPI00331AA9B5
MKLSIAAVALGWVLTTTLSGCSLSGASKSDSTVSVLAGKSGNNNEASVIDSMKDVISHKSTAMNEDLQNLKAQLEQQQQRLESMNDEQKALQEQLKRQSITLQILPAANANAGRAKQGTASTAYIGFLEEENQFAEVEERAAKEVSVIPNRATSLKLSIPQDAQFIAIKVGLRHTQKRSQVLIPLDSIDFDQALVLNVGACDINIKEGVDPELVPDFTTKLKYYQQPLVSCL